MIRWATERDCEKFADKSFQQKGKFSMLKDGVKEKQGISSERKMGKTLQHFIEVDGYE